MMTPRAVLDHGKAERFRLSRIHMASRRAFDIRHPEMVKILKSSLLVFSFVGDTPELPDEWESVSLMLNESISRLGVQVARS
jgi:hypothetical protein